ncbi:MAG: DNA polymerase Y family protein [Pirellulales bacterium]|nr:DNA polymerase Y family protein [Pirellulales bacterium]
MKRILCIRLPDWPLQRLTIARPELKQLPVAILPDDPAADREALETLATECGRFSPSVAVEESTMPDSLLLDVTGLADLFGGEVSLAAAVADHFQQRHLAVHVAVADTLGAAWAVTHFYRVPQGPESAGTGFPWVVPPGGSLAALRPLPIEALRLADEAVDLLHQLGIRRIEQLEALPRRELASRFGPPLLRRWDQAVGRAAEPLPTHRPAPQFRADWSPPQPTARRDTIEAALEQLIGQVAAELALEDRGAMRLDCRLDCTATDYAGMVPVPVCVGLFEPTASARHLFELAQVQLQRLRLPGPLAALCVTAAATAPLIHRQQEMPFGDGGDSPRQHARQLAALVDRLCSRLGRRAVVRARLVADAQPELAWRRDPLLQDSRRRGMRKATPADLPPRPLRLLPRPLALAAASLVPDGPPLQFCLRRQPCRVAHTWGPERIETGWWRGRTVGRDYYRVETTDGRRFWLFRRLRDGRWFAHGVF